MPNFHSHAHRQACMTHKLGFPAGLPTVDRACTQARTHLRCMGRTAVAPLPIFAFFQQGRMPFARHRRTCVACQPHPSRLPRRGMRGNLILGRTAVPRATPEFEAQLLANLIQAGLHRVCTPGARARPRVLSDSMSPCTGLGCPAEAFQQSAPRVLYASHACLLQPSCNAFAASEEGRSLAYHGVRKSGPHRPYTFGAAALRSGCTAVATKVCAGSTIRLPLSPQAPRAAGL